MCWLLFDKNNPIEKQLKLKPSKKYSKLHQKQPISFSVRSMMNTKLTLSRIYEMFENHDENM